MTGDSVRSAGADDGILDTYMPKGKEETRQADGHIRDPECFPSWAPELYRRKKGAGSPLSKDVPLIRELEGKSAVLRGKSQRLKKRPRAIDEYDAHRQHIQKLHGQELPPSSDGRPEIEECTISQFPPVSVSQVCEDRMKYIFPRNSHIGL